MESSKAMGAGAWWIGLGLNQWRGGEILCLSLAVSILSLSFPIALRHGLDRVPADSDESLAALAVACGIALGLETFLRISREYLHIRIATSRAKRTEEEAFDRILDAESCGFEDGTQRADRECFEAVARLRAFVSDGHSGIALDALTSLIALGLLVVWGGWWSLIALGAAAAMIGHARLRMRSITQLELRRAEGEDKRARFLESTLGELLAVRAWGAEQRLLRRFEALEEDRENVAGERSVESSHVDDFAVAWRDAAMVVIAAVGFQHVASGAVTIGAAAACVLLTGVVLDPLRQLISFADSTEAVRRDMEKVRAVLRRPQRRAPISRSRDESRVRGEVELRGIPFASSIDPQRNATGGKLLVKPGETVGITGPNGSGKTWLLELIRGLRPLEEGEVLIDGRPLEDWPRAVLARDIAFLPQTEHLFRGSILDNLTMFRPHLERDALGVADRMGISRRIGRLSRGFQTQIGVGHQRELPRGLAQSLCIARGLIQPPRILLFDEPNLAVDDEADRLLIELLEGLQGDCTILMVSQRPRLLRLADRVIGMPWMDGPAR